MADNVLLNGNTVGARERNYGIDLLRVISMFMVVLLHVNLCVGLLDYYEANTLGYIFVWGIEAFAFCSVNVYAIISGYVLFNSRFKLKRLLQLYLEVLFFNLVSHVLMATINHQFYGFKDFIKGFIFIMPLKSRSAWYFNAYFLLFLIYPLLNLLTINMNKRQFIFLFIILGVLSCILLPYIYHFDFAEGYSFIWIVSLYFVGVYFKKYGFFKLSAFKNCICYVGVTMLILLIRIINNILPPLNVVTLSGYRMNLKYEPYLYTSIFVILQSVFLFNGFAKIKVKNNVFQKILLTLSPLAFGIYVVHLTPYARMFFNNFLFIKELSVWLLIPLIFACAVMVFSICALIVWVKQLLFKYTKIDDLTFKVGDFIQNKITAFADKKAEE